MSLLFPGVIMILMEGGQASHVINKRSTYLFTVSFKITGIISKEKARCTGPGETRIEMESEWRDVFVQKSINDIREIVYDTRAKATAKKSELQTVVRFNSRIPKFLTFLGIVIEIY